jgi:hypothetical protein
MSHTGCRDDIARVPQNHWIAMCWPERIGPDAAPQFAARQRTACRLDGQPALIELPQRMTLHDQKAAAYQRARYARPFLRALVRRSITA